MFRLTPAAIFLIVPAIAAPPPKAADEPVKWSTIRGRLVFDGDPIPVRKAIPKGAGAMTEDWIVHPKTRAVMNVIVWLAPEPTKDELERLKAKKLKDFPSFKPAAIHPSFDKPVDNEVFLSVQPKAFLPHVLALQAGAQLTFKQLDTAPENVKIDWVKNAATNRLLKAGAQFSQVVAAEKLPVRFESNISPWMYGYVAVFDHPYFAVTGADGEFEIKNVPAGDLRIFYWHEKVGYRNRADGRLGDPIRVEKKELDLGDVKLKPAKD